MPATGLEPLTAKLISLNETVETGNDEVHHSSLICLVNELAHGLAVPEQVRMIVENVLHCWALEKQITYTGRTLPQTDSYKYLGTTFTPAGMAGHGLAQVRSNVGRAFDNVRFKFDRLGCTSNIHLQLHLYDAIVTPQPCHPVRSGASTQRRSSSGDGWRPYTAATFAAFAGCRTACLRRR